MVDRKGDSEGQMRQRVNNGTLAFWDVSMDPKYKEFVTSFSTRKRDTTTRADAEKKRATLAGRKRAR